MHLAAVRLFVRDLDGAIAFYRDRLGLALNAHSQAWGYAVFDGGRGANVVVESVPPDAPDDEQALVGRFSGVGFEVADIAAEHARLVAAGVPFDGAPERQAWGGITATLRDPAGNELQLAQYPK
jgi:catechol 2,3-dioxygenase-like lactoylglutathione lyase family enzyme